jgi:hypothetical protein
LIHVIVATPKSPEPGHLDAHGQAAAGKYPDDRNPDHPGQLAASQATPAAVTETE